jgi:hypothetical protein
VHLGEVLGRMEAKQHLVYLYQHRVPEELYWSEGQALDFLGARLSGLVEARPVLDEVGDKGQATGIIEFSARKYIRLSPGTLRAGLHSRCSWRSW